MVHDSCMNDRSSSIPPLAGRILLHLTALTTLVFWLPTVRGLFDGQTYEWNLFEIGGRGIGGDYWFVLLGSAFGIAVQRLGWRRERFAAGAVILGWFLLLTAGSLYLGLQHPQDFRFRGDTLGVDIPLVWFGPTLFGLATAAAVWWIWDEARRGSRRAIPSWNRKNFIWLAVLVAMLPVQFLLLRLGEPHGFTDKIGVVLVIMQWLSVGRVFRPQSDRNPTGA